MPTERAFRRGFTAIELIVVTIVIGILASAGMAKYQGFAATARKSSCLSNQSQIAAAIKLAENDLGALPASSVLRLRYNGAIDPVSLYSAPGDPAAYRIWGRAVPRAWGVTNGSPLNTTVLQKTQDTRMFACPEDARVLGPQYQSISALSGQATATPTDPVTYIYAKNMAQPRGSTFNVPATGPPGPTTDPLEGYNWLQQQIEWSNSAFCFCRRWGLRDTQVSGASAGVLDSTAADASYQPNRERHLSHSSFAASSP